MPADSSGALPAAATAFAARRRVVGPFRGFARRAAAGPALLNMPYRATPGGVVGLGETTRSALAPPVLFSETRRCSSEREQ